MDPIEQARAAAALTLARQAQHLLEQGRGWASREGAEGEVPPSGCHVGQLYRDATWRQDWSSQSALFVGCTFLVDPSAEVDLSRCHFTDCTFVGGLHKGVSRYLSFQRCTGVAGFLDRTGPIMVSDQVGQVHLRPLEPFDLRRVAESVAGLSSRKKAEALLAQAGAETYDWLLPLWCYEAGHPFSGWVSEGARWLSFLGGLLSLSKLNQVTTDGRRLVSAGSLGACVLWSELGQEGRAWVEIDSAVGRWMAAADQWVRPPPKTEQAARAADPDTALEELYALAPLYPEEFLANPVLPLLLLENPRLWEALPGQALAALGASPSCPVSLVEWMLSGPTLRSALHFSLLMALLENSQLPLSLRQRLYCQSTDDNYRSIKGDPDFLRKNLGQDLASLLLRAGLSQRGKRPADPDPALGGEALAQLASLGPLGKQLASGHPNAGPELLAALASEPDLDARCRVASQSRCPVQVLERLSEDPSAWPRSVVAQNPSTPAQALQRLAADPEDEVVCGLARNPACPPEVLLLLTQAGRGMRVRLALAECPRLPASAMQLLAEDPADWVRTYLARNPSLPPELEPKLARDQVGQVRETLAKHGRVPAVLVGLAQDPDPDVRKRLQENPLARAALLAARAGR